MPRDVWDKGPSRSNVLLNRFMSHQISRRAFVNSPAATGLSTAGIAAMLKSAGAMSTGAVAKGRRITGTGGQLIVEHMKVAGIKYLFTNNGSFEVGFSDAFLDQPGQLIMGLHEGIVISLADGYHKMSGEPAFVNVHVIAGTAQSAGQLYYFSRDGSSIVVTAELLLKERTRRDKSGLRTN